MVEFLLAKEKTRVRFPLPALAKCERIHKEILYGGDRIRTCDLKVMSLASYQTALPRVSLQKEYYSLLENTNNNPLLTKGLHNIIFHQLDLVIPGNKHAWAISRSKCLDKPKSR